jgi:ribosomal protein L11 methyltransferase
MPLVKLVVRTPRKMLETVSAVLFEAGAGGIEELDRGRRLVVYAASKEDADRMAERARELLREAAPGPSGITLDVEVDESSDWESAWTKHLGQVALTPRLVIQPQHDERPAPSGTQRILFHPQLAFGDGGHPTTRLAAAALERACRACPAARVLDFGSGTGVLAFVALLSGAGSAYGVDLDPVSVAAAQRNAQLNGLSERATFGLPRELTESDFDLVIANLEAPALLSSASHVARLATRAKLLILTGFLPDRAPEIAAAFAAFAPGFSVARQACEEDWALLELVPAA